MKIRNLVINLLIGIILLSIPILTSPDFGGKASLFEIVPFKINFLGYFILLLFYYVHYYYLIPVLYVKKRLWLYVGSVLLSFLMVYYLPSWLVETTSTGIKGGVKYLPVGPEPIVGKRPLFDLFKLRDTFIFQFLMVLVFSFLLKLDNQLKEIRAEKLRSEVSYLKAQINPHFLFNTLNSIYALILTKSDKAPKAVLKLSDMMRYVVTESDSELVALANEIGYISDYIALQKLRIGENIVLEFRVTGNPSGKQIAPIILINYVENAFKFGVNPDRPSKINILINVDEHGVLLEVKNRISVDKKTLLSNTKEGLKNTKKRLDFLYAGKYTLNIKQDLETYHVKLYIELR